MIENKKKIRNFSIIAHVDHGKSTLADRLLEITNFKGTNKNFERVLDSLGLEQEKGITIKLNSVQLIYQSPLTNDSYVFNLIDTPGHVDFMYEVSRSLAACEGVILLVDATKGIQAQTLAYYNIAKELNLKIIPVINKVDLPSAQIEESKSQIMELVNCDEEDICLISAKSGLNVDKLCEKIVQEINPPLIAPEKETKALVFDLLYNKYHGVIVYFRIVEGELSRGQKIKFYSNQKTYQIDRIGIKTPKEELKEKISSGEIG
jgi:GTP-binding protein LepA